MLIPDTRTLKSVIETSAGKYPDRKALAFVDGPGYTYAQLLEEISKLQQLLSRRGIQKGHKVGLLGENMPNWGVAYLAIVNMGAVVVPVLPDFHANEVHHILRHADCRAVVVSEKLMDRVLEADLPHCNTLIKLNTLDNVSPQDTMGRLMDMLRDGEREVQKLRDSALKLAGLKDLSLKPEDLAAIIYTSGTTGHAKGVMLTHHNIVSDLLFIHKIQQVTEQDRFLSILPLSHTYENTIGFLLPLSQGSAVYYLDKPPVARHLLPALEKIRPTMMLTVPLIIEKIAKTKVFPKLESGGVLGMLLKVPFIRHQFVRLIGKKLVQTFGGKIHFFGVGGASLSPQVEAFLREARFPYAIGYGLTETAPLIAGCSPKITRARSTGFPLPDLEVRIADADPETGEGEIQVKGDNVMQGYYKDPERTAEVFTSDGYFKTGDLGVLDQDGYLYIKGRLKNVIIGANGENIYPEELEAHLNRQAGVLESLVYMQDNRITARVFLDYDHFDKRFNKEKLSQPAMAAKIKETLEAMRQTVNKLVGSNARIHHIIEQTAPFEKTPTKKIKRFLYTDDRNGNSQVSTGV